MRLAPAVRRAVADAARLCADRDRDASSRPGEVLQFIGIEPGMRVLDLNAATGYYTEILARAVGAEGRVIAHNHPGARDMLPAHELERRYAGGRLPNVEQLFARHHELDLPATGLDAVLMSLAYHDVYWFADGVDWGPIDRAAFLAAVHDALEPGGVVGVIDHCAAPGADPVESVRALHRIDPAVVRRDFTAAGFVLAGESDVLRNDADDHRLGVFDPAVRGKTARFVLRFMRSRAPSCALAAVMAASFFGMHCEGFELLAPQMLELIAL